MLAANIHEVIERLEDILASPDVAPRHKLFPAIYRQVTAAIAEGIDAGRFDDGPRMDRFDTMFANRYFRAFERHRAGERCNGAWRVAFRFADDQRGIALQHILLGMNAHINLDLAVAAARVSPGGNIGALRDDFERINDLLAAMIDGAQAALGEFSPLLDTLDRVGGRVDEAIVEFSIKRARLSAWRTAERLAPLSAADQQPIIRQLDQTVKLLGRSVSRPGPVVSAAVSLVELTESNDTNAIVERLLQVRPGH
jgi:hypothetical protein